MKIKVDVSYTEKVFYSEEIIFDEEQDDFIKEMKKEYDLACKESDLIDISFEDFVKNNFYEFIYISDYLSFSTTNIVETYDFDYDIENIEIEK